MFKTISLVLQEGGIFVECGGYDGYFLSNTFYLEKARGWTGLIIEPETTNYAALKQSGRNAIISPACLSIKPYPQKVHMTP